MFMLNKILVKHHSIKTLHGLDADSVVKQQKIEKDKMLRQ
jgi:hypothetical protein